MQVVINAVVAADLAVRVPEICTYCVIILSLSSQSPENYVQFLSTQLQKVMWREQRLLMFTVNNKETTFN